MQQRKRQTAMEACAAGCKCWYVAQQSLRVLPQGSLCLINGQFLCTKSLSRPRGFAVISSELVFLAFSQALHHSPGLLRGCCTRDIAVLFEAGIHAHSRLHAPKLLPAYHAPWWAETAAQCDQHI